MSRRYDIVILSVGVGVIVIAAAAIGVVNVKAPQLSASGTLAEYAAAVGSGDLAHAEQLSIMPKGATAPVTGTALANAVDRITSVATRINSTSRNSASGTVSYRLGDRAYSATVKLATGPAQLGILPNWRVTTPLTRTITVDVPASGTASVNGVEASFGTTSTLTVYPGRYAVALAPSNAWYSSNTVTVDAGAANVPAGLTVTPTAALGTEVLRQVKATIDACIATTDPAPSGCPFSDVRPGTVTGFSWKVGSYPTVSFLDATHFFYAGGEAQADYVYTHAPNIVNRPEEDPVALTGPGSITFVGSQVKVALG